MAIFSEKSSRARVVFSWSEMTGAVGDSVTVLPIVISLAALTTVSLPHVLLAFGVFQVVWGVYYGLPLSVEPMKALAGLAIGGVLTYAELATAGLLAGVVLLVVGATNGLAWVERVVPEPVVRGVQIAVALILLRAGVGLAVGAPAIAGLATAVAVGCALLGRARASALVVLAVGLLFTGARVGVPAPSVPALLAVPPFSSAMTGDVATGLVSQLAMTIGNAAVATSLLLADLFDADVSADDLATSMGVMNVCAVPLGGLPMCHGSGGLAGKHAFGARTGGANVVLGVLYGVAAVFAGSGFLAAFPMAVLGVLLAVVALQLGRAGLQTENQGFAVLVGVIGVATNVGVAVVVGVLAQRAWERVSGSA